MRKNLFYLFMLMAVAVMPLTSCEKDNQTEHDPNSDADQTEITAYDALSWLQGSLVVVDENGDLFRRIYGAALDESQPDVISVPVADYGAAEKLFLTWVAPGKQAIKVDDGYDYPLTDPEGKAQGSVSFRAEESEAGVLARMTVAEGTPFKQISEVKFIDHDFWPENAAYEKYEAGKIYEFDEYVLTWHDGFKAELKPLPFYCVQSNTDGKEGILVWISPDEDDPNAHQALVNYLNSALKYLPTEAQAKKVLEFYNNNNAFWANMLLEMDAKGYKWSPMSGAFTTGNSEFVLNAFYESWFFGVDKTMILDLDDKEEGDIDSASSLSWYMYRYMHIKTIPAYRK